MTRPPPSPEALEKAKRLAGGHYDCEDIWYSCPKSPDGCANDAVGDDCTCGLDERINALALALDAERAAGKAEGRTTTEELHRLILDFRGINPETDKVCGGCAGGGVKTYGSTATWTGGIGGQMVTADVCDECWGSGCTNRRWPNWRAIHARAQEAAK